MNKIVIGIGGVARAGKDTACQIILDKLNASGISAKRMALADNLKSEIRPELIENYGIDVLSCSPEEKEKIRPALVDFGKARRLQSLGTFWTGLLEEEISKADEQVIVVPDIRYAVFKKDEKYWVKEKMKGVLLHISRFIFDGPDECPNLFKNWILPANQDEAENDPRIKAAADYVIEWETANIKTLISKHGKVFDSIEQNVRSKLKVS